MISEDGRRDLYLELEGWSQLDCDPWVIRHVLPHLTGQALQIDLARRRIAEWLHAEAMIAGGIRLLADSKVDIELLVNILGPDHPRPIWKDVSYIYDRSASLRAMDRFFLSARQHHALDDAKGIRLGWFACKTGPPDVD